MFLLGKNQKKSPRKNCLPVRLWRKKGTFMNPVGTVHCRIIKSNEICRDRFSNLCHFSFSWWPSALPLRLLKMLLSRRQWLFAHKWPSFKICLNQLYFNKTFIQMKIDLPVAPYLSYF